MSMQAKPPGAIHLARTFPAGVFPDLARSAQVHHSRRIAAGDFVRFQKLAHRTSRRGVLRLGFRLPHAIGDTSNINMAARGADAINLIPDDGRVHGAQQHPAQGLVSRLATNRANFFHDFLQTRNSPPKRGALRLGNVVGDEAVAGAIPVRAEKRETDAEFALVRADDFAALAGNVGADVGGMELGKFAGCYFGFEVLSVHQVSPGCSGRRQSPSHVFYYRPNGPSVNNFLKLFSPGALNRSNSLVLLFVAVVLTFLQSCATQEASLEQRAKTWVELLGSIHAISKEQAIQRISDFIEPSAATQIRAEEYYADWMNTNRHWQTVAASVDEVTVNSTDGVGKVRITAVAVNTEDGKKKTVSQDTKWKLVNKKWYRTIVRAQITDNK